MNPYRKALLELYEAVANHPDAMMATGELHTPFMRASEVLLNTPEVPEGCKIVCEKCGSDMEQSCGWPTSCNVPSRHK